MAKETIKYVSHQHPLKLSLYQPGKTQNHPSCSICSLKVSGLVYGCESCKFFLHKKCIQATQGERDTQKKMMENIRASETKNEAMRAHKTKKETMMNNFGHPHPLTLSLHQPRLTLDIRSCSACKLQVSGLVYVCETCKLFLHKKCFEMPQKSSQLQRGQNYPNPMRFQFQPSAPEAQPQYAGEGSRSSPQPQSHGSHFMARPYTQQNPFMPHMQPHNIPLGIPAGPSIPSYEINDQNNEVLLQIIQQMYGNSLQATQNAMQLMSMMSGSGGSLVSDRGSQQLLHLLSNMYGGACGGIPGLDPFGGGGGIPGLDFSGGGGAGGIPGLDFSGGGGGIPGLDFSGGGGAGGIPGLDFSGGGGAFASNPLDAVQSLSGAANGLGGTGLNILGALGGLFGGF